jgi:GntR family transcriptional repressor for pyruvate dehydrogenase complex
MKDMLKPLKADSLKEVFIARFEGLILSGKLSIGQKLPSERELAMQLGVSRPVVHEGLMDLQTKGLVSMKSRVGTVVNDYRKEGSLAILVSLVNYHKGKLEPKLLDGLLEMRMLIEVETARLATANHSEEHLDAFSALLKDEQAADPYDAEKITELDYAFHHLIAMASDNMIYPLFLNSFKEVYTNLSGQFFSDPSVVSKVFGFHREMVKAIEARDEQAAMEVMQRILRHGEKHLRTMLQERREV